MCYTSWSHLSLLKLLKYTLAHFLQYNRSVFITRQLHLLILVPSHNSARRPLMGLASYFASQSMCRCLIRLKSGAYLCDGFAPMRKNIWYSRTSKIGYHRCIKWSWTGSTTSIAIESMSNRIFLEYKRNYIPLFSNIKFLNRFSVILGEWAK